MRLYVYVLTHDTGFAPNPFHGYCTLATCKPVIRRGADIGDWVVGVGSTQNGQEGQLIYAMRVEEAMSFEEYWTDPRFQLKKPALTGDQEFRCGDNIYHRDPATGDWIQAPGYHSFENGCQDPYHVERDTKSPLRMAPRPNPNPPHPRHPHPLDPIQIPILLTHSTALRRATSRCQ